MTSAGSALENNHVRWLSASLLLLVAAAGAGCGGGGSGTPGGSGGRGTGGAAVGSGGSDVNATGGAGPAGTGGADFTGGTPGSGGAGSGGNGTGGGGTGTGGIAGTGGAAGGTMGTGGMGRGGGGGAVSGTGGAGEPRPGLSFTPAEGIYSVALSVTTTGVMKMLTLHNGGAAPVMITGLTVTGAQATRFMVEGGPTLPASVPANGDLPVTVRFLPPTSGGTSVYSATLTATSSGTPAMVTAGLYGLAMSTGNAEPSLDQVVKTLGYAVNVGGTSSTLGTSASPIGDEIAAKRFVKADGAATVGFQPMARYSPFEAANYGYYTGSNPAVVRHPLGTMSKGPMDNVANRTLFPPLDPGAMLTFDPGTMSFGFFAESPSNANYLGADARFYQEDTLNNDQGGVLPVHRVRVYPFKNRAGQAVAATFLVVCEEANNSDYQDYVFVLSNAAVSPN